jgi:RNA polymerase sigma factor (sigma-70 family)
MRSTSEFNNLYNKCLSNSRSHQKKLYIKYYPSVYTICLRYAPNKHDCLDYTQDVFIKVFDVMSAFKGESYAEFGAWIKRVTTNYCIDQYRKNKKHNNLVSIHNIPESIADPDKSEYTELDYDVDQIINAMHKLSPSYRTIFNMYVMEGHRHKEIAEILGISVGTSKSNYHKAKKNIKNILEKDNAKLV